MSNRFLLIPVTYTKLIDFNFIEFWKINDRLYKRRMFPKKIPYYYTICTYSKYSLLCANHLN